MMHIIAKVATTAAIPAAVAVVLGYLAMTAQRTEEAQQLYASSAIIAILGMLSVIVVWVGHRTREQLQKIHNANKEAQVRLLMKAATDRGADMNAIFGPKER